MPNAFLASLSLVDASGQIIIVAIVCTLAGGVLASAAARRRYALLKADLEEHPPAPETHFTTPILDRIDRDVRQAALGRSSVDVSIQAIVEQRFQSDLATTITAERFVRTAPHLTIILGLVGTFYGLTSSIGKLVALVSGQASASGDVAQALTFGLTGSLGGMSVAFSTSLFGILSAIVLTLLGVFWNVADKRTEVMVQIEAYFERVVAAARGADPAATSGVAAAALDPSIARLQASVERFDEALTAFASSTREFGEINLHLKDNIERMSLCFGDLGDSLRREVASFKSAHEAPRRP